MTKKNIVYSDKSSTSIWFEEPAPDNPYATKQCYLHGYDLFDVAKNATYIETLFLLFLGELPNKRQAALLEKLMIFLINPGPRHNATRAAMNAGVGKTDPAHILPIGLITLGGSHLGSSEVEKAMHFFIENKNENAEIAANKLLNDAQFNDEGDNNSIPGFGTRYNSIDNIANSTANFLLTLSSKNSILHWGDDFAKILKKHNQGWLVTGVAAATLCDLGFAPREGACLFQLMSAPGILAHGLEQTHKPITAMPMLKDENYVIEK